MPRLAVLSGQEVVEALQRLGLEMLRQRGSHVIMRRGSAGCSVPMHSEVKRGTLAAIRQAEIEAEELIAALK